MNKYNARKAYVDGYTFDSQAEARRYGELRILEKNGEIAGLQVHPRYLIWEGRDKRGKLEHIYYEGDFEYSAGEQRIVEDVKGVRTAIFNLKLKLFRARYHDLELKIVDMGGKR